MKTSIEEGVVARLFPVRNRKGDETKMRMVRAAIELIAQDGVEKLTFEAIGRRIGTTPAQVRYHFPETSTLIDRAIQFAVFTYQEMLLKSLHKKKDWKEQVRACVAGTFEWAKAYPEQGPVYLIFMYWASINPKYRELHNQMFQSGVARMAAILSQAGKKLSDSELRARGLSMWSLIDGFLYYHITISPPGEGPTFFRRQALDAVNRALEEW